MSIIKENKPVAVCCDHAGYETKLAVIDYLKSVGIAVRDFGTHSNESCDYPDFAHPCALAVESGDCYPASLIRQTEGTHHVPSVFSVSV